MLALGQSLWTVCTADYGKNHKTEAIEKDFERRLSALEEKARHTSLTPEEDEEVNTLMRQLNKMRGHEASCQRRGNYIVLAADIARYGATWVNPVAAGVTAAVLDKAAKPRPRGKIMKAEQSGKGQPRRRGRAKNRCKKISQVNKQDSSWMPDMNSLKVGAIACVSTYCFSQFVVPLAWDLISSATENVCEITGLIF